MPADRRTGPVVLLGFDAADPDLVERWAREGKLPAMARLMSRGAWARTTGPELLFEHGIWSTLFSGVSVAKHGFHFFWQPVPGTYGLELKRARELGVTPFWSQLAGTGRSVLVLDPPDTEPVPGLARTAGERVGDALALSAADARRGARRRRSPRCGASSVRASRSAS